MIPVPVIPGDARSVTKIGQNDVTGQYKCPIPRADTRRQSHNVGIDRLTVLALLGFCLIADGGALFLCGWLYGGH